jgi:hypothetical protein
MTTITKEFLEQKAQELNNNGISAEYYEYTDDAWDANGELSLVLKWHKDGLVHYIEWEPEDECGLYFEGIDGKPISPETLGGIEDGRLYYRYRDSDTPEGEWDREYYAAIPDGYYEDPYSTLDETPTTKDKK